MKMNSGILFTGPPGSGKTLLAKILAAKLNANFFVAAGSQFVKKYIGEGQLLVDELFKTAKNLADVSKKISIIFIDEIHAIASKYINNGSSDREVNRTLARILTHMDGFDELNNVVVIGATNRPDLMDEAILRSGRFSRILKFKMPDYIGRIEIFKIHTQNLPLNKFIAFNELSEISKGFSGADIAFVCQTAIENFLIRVLKLEENNYDISKVEDILNKKSIKIKLLMEDFIKGIYKINAKNGNINIPSQLENQVAKPLAGYS